MDNEEQITKHLSNLYYLAEQLSKRLERLEKIKGIRDLHLKDIQDVGDLAGFNDAPNDNAKYVRQKGKWVCL